MPLSAGNLRCRPSISNCWCRGLGASRPVIALRLAIPFLVWVVAYIALMRYFIPRLGKISEAQADARSLPDSARWHNSRFRAHRGHIREG